MRAARLFLCLPLLAAASGCGWIFTHGPPTGHEQLEYIPCTESDAGPILDLVWGGLNVLGAIGVAADRSAYDYRTQRSYLGSRGALSRVSRPRADSRRCPPAGARDK